MKRTKPINQFLTLLIIVPPMLILMFLWFDFGLGINRGMMSRFWLGVDLSSLHILILPLFMCVTRAGYLVDRYNKADLEFLRSRYKSWLVRLNCLLGKPDDRKLILEPMYADWQEERGIELIADNKFEVFRTDFYYVGWMIWRIWRDSGIIRRNQISRKLNRRA